MTTRYFYRDLHVLASFEEAANGSLHAKIPDDWFVIVADIAGSTEAIENGRYKDVNTVGAATIMAVINVDRTVEIPFIFGGDGATLALPPSMEQGAREALLGAKDMARAGFNLDLRVGMIPARDIYKQDLWLGVGKYQHSAKITQTSLSGFGWGWAESVLKHSDTRLQYEVIPSDTVAAKADFTGFECRWKPVESRNDFKLAIIAQSVAKKSSEHAAIYAKILSKVSEIYGDVRDYHPLLEGQLGLTFDPRKLMAETRVYAAGHSFLSLCFKLVSLLLISAIGSLAFAKNLKLGKVRWGGYRREVVENADFRKFDGALKMVLDSSVEQQVRFKEFLDDLYRNGEVVFGMHPSAYAIMTCLVFTPGQDHAHFVDGSDGGYAVAAKGLKAQLSQLKSSRSQKGTP